MRQLNEKHNMQDTNDLMHQLAYLPTHLGCSWSIVVISNQAVFDIPLVYISLYPLDQLHPPFVML